MLMNSVAITYIKEEKKEIENSDMTRKVNSSGGKTVSKKGGNLHRRLQQNIRLLVLEETMPERNISQP